MMARPPVESRPESKPPLVLKLDEPGGGVTYIGEAPAGTADNTPRWKIRKMTEVDTLLTIRWAGGDKDFAWAWDERAALDYS